MLVCAIAYHSKGLHLKFQREKEFEKTGFKVVLVCDGASSGYLR